MKKQYLFHDFALHHIPCDFFTNNHYRFYITGTHHERDCIKSDSIEEKLDILKRLSEGERIYLFAQEYHYNVKNRKIRA